MHRLISLALPALVSGLLALAPVDAGAVVVTGTMAPNGAPVVIDSTVINPVTPLSLAPIAGPDYAARFTYDTALAHVVRQSATFAVYDFPNGGASFEVVVNGHVYSITATGQPGTNFQIAVGGGPGADSSFWINGPDAVRRTPDPTNPLPAFPRLSFNLGTTGAFASPALPTANFPPVNFGQQSLILESQVTRGDPRYFQIDFNTRPFVITTNVPEPVTASLIWLLGIGGMLGMGRSAARRHREPA